MVTIYTDGAASNNGQDNAIGGYGWVMELKEKDPIINGGTKVGATNNQMELLSMINALYFLHGLIDRKEYVLESDEQILVYTDSAYIANCYSQKWYANWENNGWINSKKQPVLNKTMWELLIPFFKRDNIHIVKVKGHNGNLGNEIADKVAVAARTMNVEDFTNFKNKLTIHLRRI